LQNICLCLCLCGPGSCCACLSNGWGDIFLRVELRDEAYCCSFLLLSIRCLFLFANIHFPTSDNGPPKTSPPVPSERWRHASGLTSTSRRRPWGPSGSSASVGPTKSLLLSPPTGMCASGTEQFAGLFADLWTILKRSFSSERSGCRNHFYRPISTR